MSLEHVCVLADKCKNAGTAACNSSCFPYVLTHGLDGQGGFWKAANVPTRYRDRRLHNLDILKEQNPEAYSIVKMYGTNILEYVKQGIGLYLYSVVNIENKNGTGTGKTTAAATLANEFVKARIIQHVSGWDRIEVQPAVFMRVSEFQNVYNSQFRGSEEHKIQASTKYYSMKDLMIHTELLVLDDIGLRDAKTLINEIYEIIDLRTIEGRSTILTANLPVEKIGELLSEQIASRIQEMCELVGFKGKDNRRKLL